jgi:2-C-methyl-D-erythritol 4-phosphate cytidylyltransferase
MKISVILPAAGKSTRFGEAGKSKIETELAGRPVFVRSIQLFNNHPDVGRVIIAVRPDQLDAFKLRWGDQLAFHHVEAVAGGMTERWETVRNALLRINDDTTHIAVHDAARPLTSRKLIDRVFAAAADHNAVIPGSPINATLKRVADIEGGPQVAADPLDAILGSAGKPDAPSRRVVETVSRANVVEVQTPQVFEIDLLRRAYAQIEAGKVDPSVITDDAGLVEAMGEPVVVVDGESTNLKITRPEDIQLAEAILSVTMRQDKAQAARKRLFADEDDE